LVELLLDCPFVQINATDYESGWTALHLSLYRAHIRIALALMAHSGIDMTIKDNEGLTAMELLLSIFQKESSCRPTCTTASYSEEDYCDLDDHTENSKSIASNKDPDFLHRFPCESDIIIETSELYTWGSNANYTLGQADHDDRSYPEKVDLTPVTDWKVQGPRSLNYPKDVCISKLHLAVLSEGDADGNLHLAGFGK
jgi:hypothetical protein